jgi:hypothetical protein
MSATLLKSSDKPQLLRPRLPLCDHEDRYEQRFSIGVSMGVLALAAPCLGQAQPSLTPGTRPIFASLPIIAVTQADRDRMTRSVVSVQTISVFRDRGVLDARQQARIGELESELAAALAGRDAATTNIAQAQRTLDQACAAFDAEVTTLTAANQGLKRETEALRTDTLVQVTRLSDEEVRQRQRFADGDKGALDIMDQLGNQREAALDIASEQRRAESRYDMARQFATAAERGDPGVTIADVLARWEEAATLDLTDFRTNSERTMLAQKLGKLEVMRRASDDAALSVATTYRRGPLLNTLYRTSQVQGDLTGAYDFRRQALESTRAYNQANTNDFYADFAYASTLMTTIDFTSTATSKAAKVAFNESMALTGARAATNPNSVEARRDMSRCLIVVGNILLFARDVASTQTSYTEALAISRALSAAAPSSMQDRVAVGLALER